MLAPVAQFSFLNFAIVVFVLCVVIMVTLSKLGLRPPAEKVDNLTFDWSPAGLRALRGTTSDVIMTLVVAVAILSVWVHFA